MATRSNSQHAPVNGTVTSDEPILSVRNLSVEFATGKGWIRVTDSVSLDIRRGETVGLVGESGSGKTVTSLAVMGLLPKNVGRLTPESSVSFNGHELVGLPTRKLNKFRGNDLAMIFQEPMTSLNPAFTVGYQIAEVVQLHTDSSRKDAWRRAVEVLDIVGIPSAKTRAKAYPHQFSGGMAQRAMIAMALACNPRLLIADEPTTALDVTVEANILDLLRDLQREFGMAVLLVSHDLGVIESFCDRALVMYAGQIVAANTTEGLFGAPRHPYVEGLLMSMPNPAREETEMWSIPSVVPPPWEMPEGCRFHPRCRYVEDPTCTSRPIELRRVDDSLVRCDRAEELRLFGIKHD